MRFKALFLLALISSCVKLIAQQKLPVATIIHKEQPGVDSGNVLSIKVELIKRCKYDLEVQLAKINIVNMSSDTIFLLKKDIDTLYSSVKTNYNSYWPSSNIIINNMPVEELSQQEGFINRSPAI
jgi:hypothetical protein